MNTLKQLFEIVVDAGNMGIAFQRRIEFHDREYKADGSVVTDADRAIEDFLCDRLAEVVPDSNCVTEERVRDFREGAELTFVIDPIDGTDNFSNGMHYWSLSIGVLNPELMPIGGIVYAPRLDFLIFADFGERSRLGQHSLCSPAPVTELTRLSGIMMSSRIHKQLDMQRFPGKARALGSAALNLCMPTVYPGVVGAIQDNKAFAWDVAGAHAILSSLQCDISYFDGTCLDYAKMKDNDWRVEDFIVAGKPGAITLLMQCIKKIS